MRCVLGNSVWGREELETGAHCRARERPWEAVVVSLVEIRAQIPAPWERLAKQLPTCRASDSIGLDGNKTPR